MNQKVRNETHSPHAPGDGRRWCAWARVLFEHLILWLFRLRGNRLPPERPIRRICIFARLRGPGLGDLIQRNLLHRQLKQKFPQARLWLAADTRLLTKFAAFFRDHSPVDDVLHCPPIGAWAPWGWLTFLLRLRRDHFDLCVIDYDAVTLSALHAYAVGIPRRVGFPMRPRESRFLTATATLSPGKQPDLHDFVNAYLQALGLGTLPDCEALLPAFGFQAEPLAELAAPTPIIAIHAGGAPHWNRRWPPAYFAQMALKLVARFDATLFFLGGAEEREQNRRLIEQVHQRHPRARLYDLSGSSLNHMANHLAAAILLFGNDSAPLHMAAALNTPTVTLYGPSGAYPLWERVYPHHRVLTKNYACQRIRHFAENWTHFPCVHACPYGFHENAPDYPRCLKDLDPAHVWNELERAVHQQLAPSAEPA